MKSILSETEISRARFGPRELKNPRSKAYAIQTLYALKQYAESLRCDQERVARELAEIEQYRHWEVLGYSSKADMLAAELNDTGRKNVATVLRDKPGRNWETKDNSCNTRIRSAGSNTNAAYIRARLKRDGHTELLAQVDSGEISAHAVAVQLGWRTRMVQVPATVEGFRRAAARYLTEEQCRELFGGAGQEMR